MIINNSEKMVIEKIAEVEEVFKEFVKKALKDEENKALTVNSIEKDMGKILAQITQITLGMSGELLSNIQAEAVDKKCSCGKRMVITKKRL